MLILDDDRVRALVDWPSVVEVMRGAIVDSARDDVHTPPRVSVGLGDDRLVVTAGGSSTDAGFRAGLRPGGADEVVVVWSRGSGRLQVIVVGAALGAVRTGGIGGVACDALARADARTVAVIGSGTQARTQLAAVATVRPLAEVRVHSPTVSHREDFTARARAELGLEAVAIDDARRAVEGADVVICATTAGRPVLDPAWIRPGTHVTTLGSRTRGGSELPPELVGSADVVVTDAPSELAASGSHFLDGEPVWDRIAALSDVVRRTPRRDPDAVSVFLSMGLAGTEVALARWLAARSRSFRI